MVKLKIAVAENRSEVFAHGYSGKVASQRPVKMKSYYRRFHGMSAEYRLCAGLTQERQSAKHNKDYLFFIAACLHKVKRVVGKIDRKTGRK